MYRARANHPTGTNRLRPPARHNTAFRSGILGSDAATIPHHPSLPIHHHLPECPERKEKRFQAPNLYNALVVHRGSCSFQQHRLIRRIGTGPAVQHAVRKPARPYANLEMNAEGSPSGLPRAIAGPGLRSYRSVLRDEASRAVAGRMGSLNLTSGRVGRRDRHLEVPTAGNDMLPGSVMLP